MSDTGGIHLLPKSLEDRLRALHKRRQKLLELQRQSLLSSLSVVDLQEQLLQEESDLLTELRGRPEEGLREEET